MHAFVTDVGYALRTLRKHPGFAFTAIATLALGIGATAAIFSVVNAVLLRPLPYSEPERLVHIWEDMRNRNVTDFPWPPGDFHDLRESASAFSGVAALTTGRQVFVPEGGEGEPELVRTAAITPNLFRVLGLQVSRGRDFADADGTPPPPQPVNQAAAVAAPAPPAAPPAPPRTILSHEFWQRRFGGNAGVVGTVVRIGQQSFEVVGILEPGIELLFPPGVAVERAPDLWTPLRIDFAAGSRINVFLRVVGRLKPGVSEAEAQGQLDALAADLRKRFPIKQTAGVYLRMEPMHQDLVADVKPAILALMGAVVFVLLIACANVANLLLVRAAARERELAVRAALGSSRWRLIRQMLAESVVLAAAAFAAGVLLAMIGIRMLVVLGPENLPRLDRIRIDPMVLAFAGFSGLVSAILFGLIPALRASRPDLMEVLRKSGRTGSLAAGRLLRTGVVLVEVALSFVLLVGCGLMIRSFIALQRANPGYDPHSVLTFFTPNVPIPDPAARQAYVRDLKARLEALPGVQSVTAATPLPLDGREGLARWGTDEALTDPSKFQQATVHTVLPGYFEAMRTKLIEGRTFTESDNRPDARVLVIDRILAARAFPGRSAVGRTILTRVRTPEAERFEIIGVVDHQRHRTLAADNREALFVTDGYMGYSAANRWAIRTAGDPLALAPAARAAVREAHPRVGVIELQDMQTFVDRARGQTKFALVLIGVFAAIALVLAAVGLYTILSTVVRQRTAEIGVRMAFGAEHRRIFGMMVGQGLMLSAVGIGFGVAAALAVTRVMRTMLVGVEPTDPGTFVAMVVGFLVIAAAACGVPALRAARMDPTVALREE
jgi:putative ABC transport system permease protein